MEVLEALDAFSSPEFTYPSPEAAAQSFEARLPVASSQFLTLLTCSTVRCALSRVSQPC
jgi:hypothetical protein